MVMLDPASVDIKTLSSYLETQGIRLSGPRLVTHLNITDTDIQQIIDALQRFDASMHKP